MLLIACVLILLSACTPKPIMTPVEVKIPVSIPCKVTVPPEPVWNVPALPADANLPQKVKAGFADLDLAKGYIIKLQAATQACS